MPVLNSVTCRLPASAAAAAASVTTNVSSESMSLWLDASDTTSYTYNTSTLALQTITDKSPSAHSVTISSAPTVVLNGRNGRNVFSFQSPNVLVVPTTSAIGTGDYTLMAVWMQTVHATSSPCGFGNQTSNSIALSYNAVSVYHNIYEYGSGEVGVSGGGINTWNIHVGTRSSQSIQCARNGILSDSASVGKNMTVAQLSVGRVSGFQVTGHIAEVRVYTRALTTSERLALQTEMAAKWGITLST